MAPGPPPRLGPSSRLLARVLDGALEATVAPSFSRVGYLVRRSSGHWRDPPRVDGRVVVVTGGSSGIGRAAALALGALGAEVWVLGRDADRTEAVVERLRAAGGQAEAAVVDLANGASIDAFATRFLAARDHLDALVHNAGSLLVDYAVGADGTELTVATHVLAPFRLTLRLAAALRRAPRANIVTVASGGMYTQRFDLERLESPRAGYDGVRAYARAKRAQVVLAREWARRFGRDGVASYAMHPGWVDTPGLATGLPSFARLGPLLRRPEEGADTAVWLAAGGARGSAEADHAAGAGAPEVLDGFWHDRHLRHEHYLPWTRTRDPEADGRRLWQWCAARTGLTDDR